MPFDSEVPWQPTDSKIFNKGENIGLPLKEYETWHRQEFHVLEVGTGIGASALQALLKDKVNAIGIEPGMNYTGDGDRYKTLRNDPLLAQRIAPLNAVDAIDHPLMPAEGVDVVFAQSANFAQYANSKAEFFNQLHGLVRCLKKENKNSYVTFECLNDKLTFKTRGTKQEIIDLHNVLSDINARWETRKNKYGLNYVVVYRTNNLGQDITDNLEHFITVD